MRWMRFIRAAGNRHAASELRIVSQETLDDLIVRAVEDFDVRSTAGAGAGDDVLAAVAIDVADSDIHAATE